MKEFVRMFSAYANETDVKMLVSEGVYNKEEAEMFAKNFAHNYNVKTAVSDRFADGSYVVFAYKVPEYLVRSCYNAKLMEYTFANTWFEQRRFN